MHSQLGELVYHHWPQKRHALDVRECASSEASRCRPASSHTELYPGLTALAQLFMYLTPATPIRAASHESLRGLLGGMNHLDC